MITNVLRAIYVANLGVKKTETVLVYTDRPTKKETLDAPEAERRARLRDVAMMAAETGRGIARRVIFVEYPATGAHGKEPPRRVWEAAFGENTVQALEKSGVLGPILRKKATAEQYAKAEKIISKSPGKAVNAVIGLSNFSTSHTRFRDLITRVCGTRFASMPIFDISMVETAMAADWKALYRRTTEVARVVNSAETVMLHSKNGTGLIVSKKGRRARADTGALTKAGSFGNLPAGEVFFAPVEGSAEGTLVLEWAPTRKLKSPVEVRIKNGRVVGVSGREPFAEVLLGRLRERRENSNVAEFGIGTNDMARRPDNVLESEKILGTVHVAFGDNSSFGGLVSAPFHQDFVFFHPTVILMDGKGEETTLIEEGRLVFGDV